ncbi:MAG: hypothetical protein EOP86_27825 [Verrucomicrobiaceae bacterium]|nr:MAG: hypothetical protein EOP86_27825 [Verrucomicrobiaceae bacterium]
MSMACGQCDWPIVWVDRHLLDAVARTEPPADMRLDAISWPFPGMAFALPTGTLRHSVDGECSWMAIARLSGDLRCPISGTVVQVRTPSVACYTASLTKPNPTTLQLALPETASLADAAGLTLDRYESSYMPEHLPDPHPDDTTLAGAAFSLGMRLLLALTVRPEYLEGSFDVGTHASAARSGWTPVRWAGRGHRHNVTGEGDATGAGVRLHWRRGHFRSQPHGEGRTLRKLIWLEPVLVGDAP